ncbi:hypothetical protein [Agromyces lapidis]|uniref:Alpha/beta hydrolase n=1 Tax=Agromyces lapidis TaxID=279574 RepID=A0ABV5SKH9_9MICO|nr:hypothetical protein [Agromyces lapidis]
MSDTITISGGGSTAVATDELFADAARLGGAATAVSAARAQAGALGHELDAIGADHGTGWAEPRPAALLRELEMELRRCEADGEELRAALLASAERYGWTERAVDGLWQFGGGVVAYLLGSALTTPAGLLFAGGVALTAGLDAAAAKAWGSTPLGDWLAANRGLLSDPLFVRAVRAAVDSVDEFAVGAARLPGGSGLAAAFGDLVNAPESASMLLGVAALVGSRALVDGPVSVRRAEGGDRAGDGAAPAGHPSAGPERSVRAPGGFADLAARIPGGEGPQIRIERYGEPGDPRWVVYISGTVDPAIVAGEQPFDMVSNLHGVADDSPLDALRLAGAESGAGERAVRDAMLAAGMAPGDPVYFAGHSGGGIIVHELVKDPELNAIGGVNLGGPGDSAPTRDGVPVLDVAHDEDLVPAVGGAGRSSPERTTVTRSVLGDGHGYEGVLPAHSLESYRDTAALIDASEATKLVELRELIAFTGGGTGAVSEWIAERDPAGAAEPALEPSPAPAVAAPLSRATDAPRGR